MKFIKFIYICFFVYLSFVSSLLCAVADEERVLRGVSISGNSHFTPDEIISYAGLNVGKEIFTPDLLLQTFHKLYRTGWFEDVRLKREGDLLKIAVVENKFVNNVSFSGSSLLKNLLAEEGLRSLSRVNYFDVLNSNYLCSVQESIREIYRSQGYPMARTNSDITFKDYGRKVDIDFKIFEGPSLPVSQIFFMGNQSFSSKALKELITTKETSVLRHFLMQDDCFHPTYLKQDQKILIDFYRENGFLDCKIIAPIVEFSLDDNASFITYRIEEGERYTLKEMSVVLEEGLSTDYASLLDKFSAALGVNSGEAFSPSLLILVENAFNKFIKIERFPFLKLSLNPIIDPVQHTVELKCSIQKKNLKDLVYIRRIHVFGNENTDLKVLRREFSFVEGDLFYVWDEKETIAKLMHLEAFASIRVEKESISNNQVDIYIIVEEKKNLGEFGGALAMSDYSGISGTASINKVNIAGSGNRGAFSISVSNGSENVSTYLTIPHGFGKGLDSTFFATARRSKMIIDSDSQSIPVKLNPIIDDVDDGDVDDGLFGSRVDLSAGVSVSYALTPRLQQRLSIKGLYDKSGSMQYIPLYSKIFKKTPAKKANAQRADSSLLKREDLNHKKRIYSSIGQKISYSNSILRKLPYRLTFENEVASFGVNFIRTEVGANIFYAFDRHTEWVLSLESKYRFIYPLGGKVLDRMDRFAHDEKSDFILRGFVANGIGPRDDTSENKKVLGGAKCISSSLKLKIPLSYLTKSYGISAFLFTDWGSLWDSTEEKAKILNDSMSLCGSMGFGFLIPIPILGGKCEISWAKILKKNEWDSGQIVGIRLTG